MSYEFKPGEYELANGCKAKIFEKIGERLLGYYIQANGVAWPDKWYEDGTMSRDGSYPDYRLVPPKQTRTGWVNIYATESFFYYTRELADKHASKERIACIPITIEFTPGEGLD